MEIIKRWLADEIGVPSSNGEGHFERDFANGFNFGMVSTHALPSRLAQVLGWHRGSKQPFGGSRGRRTYHRRMAGVLGRRKMRPCRPVLRRLRWREAGICRSEGRPWRSRAGPTGTLSGCTGVTAEATPMGCRERD